MRILKPLGRIPRVSPFSRGRRRSRSRRRGLLLLALFVAVGVLPALYASYPDLITAPSPNWVRGAYHLHSKASDGRGTVEDVAHAARESGLQFAILTDHNQEAISRPRYEDGVLLIFGTEFSTSSGHLIALGIPKGPTEAERKAQTDPVAWVQAQGGLAVVAHPIQARNPWKDSAAAERANGYELYSGDTLWRQALRFPFSRLLPAVGALWIRPRHAMQDLVTGQPEATEQILQLSSREPKIALCAHDAHGFPPYRTTFDSMALYLPLGGASGLDKNPEAAARSVLGALGTGSAICAFRALGEPEGFALTASPAPVDGRRAASVGTRIQVTLPAQRPIRTRVEVAGAGTLEPDGVTVRLERPGTVQIEVWALAPGPWWRSEWKPWLVTSPIQVLPPKPPPPAPPPDLPGKP